MKLSLSIALTSVSVTRAVLGPGYEDYLWCPAGDCEIYINPFGYMGPVSMYNKCFDTTTGTFSNGVWTGDKTNVTAPEGWTQPPKCTAAEYSQCDTAAECSLQVGPGCSCYVSSTVFPFDASNFRDATCTGNECDGHEAECSAGPDGEGNTCMIKFNLVATPPATNVTTGTGATTLPVTGENGTVVVTTATTAATTAGGAIIEDKETITTTSSTAAAGGGPVPTPAPSSGNVASVSISLFVVSAAVFGYFS